MKELNEGIQSIISTSGDVSYLEGFIPLEDSIKLYEWMKKNIDWMQYPIKMFGKTFLQPRLIAFQGDKDIQYSYSNTKLIAAEWSEKVFAIKTACEKATKSIYNCVLINYYRDGNDSMGWHSDDEDELGDAPAIASVSIGIARKIDFRLKTNHRDKIQLQLSSGSLLFMAGQTQRNWQHQIAKSKKIKAGRINLTFRNIID